MFGNELGVCVRPALRGVTQTLCYPLGAGTQTCNAQFVTLTDGCAVYGVEGRALRHVTTPPHSALRVTVTGMGSGQTFNKTIKGFAHFLYPMLCSRLFLKLLAGCLLFNCNFVE